VRGDRTRRTVAIGIVVLAVAAAWTTDRALSSPSSSPPTVPASAVLAPAGASSSVWYCSGTAGVPQGNAATVLVTDAGDRPVTADVENFAVTKAGTTSATAGPAGAQPVPVPAGSQVAVPVSAGAEEVLVHGGSVGVAEEFSGPLGFSEAPCAGTSSANWYFPWGRTTSGAGLQLVLFDPMPTPAVANAAFVTAAGATVQPPAYQGVPIEPGAVVVENVGDHLPDGTFATEVTTASGTVVADEVDEAGGAGQGWMSVVGGIDAPETTWAFPESPNVAGGDNTFTVLDPSDAPATVTVSFALSQGGASPLVLHVPGHTCASLTSADQTRIPAGTLFGLRFTSSGPGVVVGRTTYVPGAAPAATGVTQGLPGGLRRWLLPPSPPGRIPLQLAVMNVGSKAAHVRMSGLGPAGRTLPPAPPVVVPAGSAVAVQPSPATPVGLMPIEVTADGPVVVELEPGPAGATGVSVVPAWPLLAAVG
jgi:hypothetical protein